MKNESGNKRLLADILAEENDPALREAMLGRTLILVRRRRYFRKARRVGSLCAILAGALLLLWRYNPPGSRPGAAPAVPASFSLVLTSPLANQQIISTEKLPTTERVVSFDSLEVVTTSGSHEKIAEINDDQLLAFAGTAPVVLVREGPHSASLVLVNEEDRETLFKN
jgi:hypothetical protein